MNFEKYGVSSFTYQPTREPSVEKEAVNAFIQNAVNDMTAMVSDPTVESIAITAIVRREDASIRAQCITLDEDNDGLPRAVSAEYGWRHRVPESATTAFGTMSDAIAILMTEDEDTNLITLDMGDTLIGNFCTGNCDTDNGFGDDDQDTDNTQSDDHMDY